eukprot:TRINITY_DN2787_c0_g1_i12.p1 TRINITY_DN2787_c0_g1~~TRINITY_DN2787_c0_g1_i12.p1  ORF type:complete len:244 (+),score=57.86 TRINITY_DN2787_c0_g1_i12:167-898(+)
MIRHGESSWNKENRFTGWTDVPLSKKGIEEAKSAGKVLKQKGFNFDVAFTSLLQRAIQTYNYAQEELGQLYIPVYKHWRLNEKHYGSLQGLNKSETAKKFGEKQVKIWRRSYDIAPAPLKFEDKATGFDQRYKNVPRHLLPLTESLKDCVARVIPYWYDAICPEILAGKNVLIVAHGNSLRSIVKHISNISEKNIVELNIPTGVPLVYEFDCNIKPVKNYYLADPEELRRKQEAVAKQGSTKN